MFETDTNKRVAESNQNGQVPLFDGSEIFFDFERDTILRR
jgi:hypothetical protein